LRVCDGARQHEGTEGENESNRFHVDLHLS
jgi:hypothetical protein